MLKILVTGGAAFISSALVRMALDDPKLEIINFDKLTFAGNFESLKNPFAKPGVKDRYNLVERDICDSTLLNESLIKHRPDSMVHLAVESHVYRSIDGSGEFIENNINGKFNLPRNPEKLRQNLEPTKKKIFKFRDIFTGEVFGSLGEIGPFTETTRYDAMSPCSSPTAVSDHPVNALDHSYGLPTVMTNYSNTYRLHPFPEKLIPLMIRNAKEGKKLLTYGDGLYVDDHARALLLVSKERKIDGSHNIGGKCEKVNIDVVDTICDILDERIPKPGLARESLREFVKDRPGHDQRYAIDPSKIGEELVLSHRRPFLSV